MADRPGEFDLIARYFAPLTKDSPGALGLLDDAGFISVPQGKELIVTKDMMVGGVHFFEDDPADLIARKLLRVNLSDLAAMGAEPHCYSLACAFNETVNAEWLAAFAAGLAQDQEEFSVFLLGGDTVGTPGPLTLSLTAFGLLRERGRLTRGGARPGDRVYVSGTIGDGALGLLARQGRLDEPDLIDRYLLPRPRTTLGPALLDIASACLDVSDGLVGDAAHIADVSEVAVLIEAMKVPLSDAAMRIVGEDKTLLTRALTGGDDYELLFTAPPEKADEIAEVSRRIAVPVTEIGEIRAGSGVGVIASDGSELPLEREGFTHF